MINNILTASRMVAFLLCPRKHYWMYEIGLRRTQDGLALKFGAAWARGQEARWNGKKYEDALAIALEDCGLDEFYCSVLSALLAGYYAFYKTDKKDLKIQPEEEFHFDLGFGGFIVAGKLDGIGIRRDKSQIIIESKTTSDSIAPDASYWMRLKFNMQILQYLDAAQRNGWEISEIIYDVTRKPQIRPKEVQELDEKGLVVVRNSEGQRVKNSKTGEWKKTADKTKGEYIQSHTETAAEFSDRLFNDTLQRPEFYFARKSVNIMERDLEMFMSQRLAIAAAIINRREAQQVKCSVESKDDITIDVGPEAWPRNVLDSTCSYCPYKSFCLQNIDIDPKQPMEGFSVQPFNPELSTNYEHNTTAQDDSTAE